MLSPFIIAQDSVKINHTLQEVIVASNKVDSKLSDVSTKIDIIDSKKIEASNGKRLPDLLKTSSNIFLKSYGLTPALTTVSVNGLGAEHTLILVDGIKINSFQNSHLDLSIIPKHLIEKIEIINNGVSSIYGSDAIGGVVNIILKNKMNLSEEKRSSLNFQLSQGSFNTKGISLDLYHDFKKFNSKISFNREISNGSYDYYYKKNGKRIIKQRQNGEYDLYDVAFTSQYIINDKNFLKIISTLSEQNKNLPGIETGTTPPPAKQIDKNWNNILIINNELSKRYFLRTSFNFQNNFMNYSVGSIINNKYENKVLGFNTELKIKEENYAVTTGYNFAYATLKSEQLLDGILRRQHALFVSTFYKVNDRFRIYASIRYDYISDISQDNFTYKIGINIKPFNIENFRIKGNFGKNFRAPSFNDLYWKNSGNINLKHENSLNLEGGFHYSFNSFFDGDISVFYTHIAADNKIIWTPGANGLWAPENVDESVSNNYSLNFNLKKNIFEKLSFNINGGIQLINTKKISGSYKDDITKDKYLPYIPLETYKANLGIKYYNASVNLFYTHTGKRFYDFANKRSMKDFDLIDGSINYKIIFSDILLNLKLEINNIFNKEYEIISGYPMPLRFYNFNIIINY